MAVADASSHLLYHVLLLLGTRHAHSQLERDGIHLAAHHHRADQFSNVVNAHQIVLEDVRGHTIEKLYDTHCSRLTQHFFVLNRADDKVFNRFQLEEIVNLAVVGGIFGQLLTTGGLLGQGEYLLPRGGDIGNNGPNYSGFLVCKIVDVTHSVAC